MKAKRIVMLTKHDKTVANALEVFESSYDLPVEFWGFKDIGLPENELAKLVNRMKEAGKKTFLEVVSYTPEACIRGAEQAADLGFDYLMGTMCYPEVWDYLQNKDLQYLPFVGEVSGSPSILEGSVDQIVEQGLSLMKKGIIGFNLLAYRHIGDPETLIREFGRQIPGIIVIAGSIDTPERMRFVDAQNTWAFTMGSALFNGKFAPEQSFRENLKTVVETMDGI